MIGPTFARDCDPQQFLVLVTDQLPSSLGQGHMVDTAEEAPRAGHCGGPAGHANSGRHTLGPSEFIIRGGDKKYTESQSRGGT